MSLAFNNSEINLIGRITEKPVIQSNAKGMKFIFFNLACNRGFTDKSYFVNGLYLAGIPNGDGSSYDNSSVETFEKNVRKGSLLLVEAHFDGYDKPKEGGGKEYVEQKRVDGFRVLVHPKDSSTSSASSDSNGADGADPLDIM